MMAEKAILSNMLSEPAEYIRRALGDGLKPEMFFRLGQIFESVIAYHREHGDIDLTAFVQWMQLDGTLDRCGGPSAIADLYTYSAGNIAAWPIYVAQVRECYALRLANERAIRMAGADSSESAIQVTEDALNALREAVRGPKRAITGREAAQDFSERLEAAAKAGDFPGKATGIRCIDLLTGGMKPGEFWVIGGKPSRGKSVLMLQIAALFIERGDAVAIFSLEMMRHEIIGRLVSNIGRVDHGKITQPRKIDSKLDMAHIQTAVRTIAASNLYIDDSANQNTETILNEATRLRDAQGRMDLVVVDYLQLVRGNRQRGESREEEVARVSGSLKQLAKALECPVISATQLNEAGQSRESRAIEQDADAALYIGDDGIKVCKLRNGSRDDVLPLRLKGEYQRFIQTDA